MRQKNIDDVRSFWESNPLFAGESPHPAGSREYFDHHRAVIIADCFAGHLDERLFPEADAADHVLDLGCGPGFWTVELLKHGARQLTACDLTEKALELTRRRTELFDVQAEMCRENAERTSFAGGTFSHVNCQGVIHHTPDTEACVGEIARVLRPGGTALISVYYKNFFLRHWGVIRWVGRVLSKWGAGLRGRGREGIYAANDVDEIVRLYDGDLNPIGKAYSREEYLRMLTPHFEVLDLFFHFFPARSLPIRIPRWLHRLLDRQAGFMIYALCRKR